MAQQVKNICAGRGRIAAVFTGRDAFDACFDIVFQERYLIAAIEGMHILTAGVGFWITRHQGDHVPWEAFRRIALGFKGQAIGSCQYLSDQRLGREVRSSRVWRRLIFSGLDQCFSFCPGLFLFLFCRVFFQDRDPVFQGGSAVEIVRVDLDLAGQGEELVFDQKTQ